MSLGEKSILTISGYDLSLSLFNSHSVIEQYPYVWRLANIRIWRQWLRLWRPVSISKLIKIFHMSCVRVAQPNVWLGFFSWQSSSWSLTRIYHVPQWLPGSHPAKFKTCLVSARCIWLKPHPSCIDLRQALPPQSPSSVLIVVLPCWRERAFWSSVVELKAINWDVQRQDFLASSSAVIFILFADRKCNSHKACLFGYPSHHFFFWSLPPTVISCAGSDFRAISSLFSPERYLIAVEWEFPSFSPPCFSPYVKALMQIYQNKYRCL